MLKIGFQILVDGDKIRQEGRRMEMLMEEWRFHNSKSENDCGKEKEVAYQKGMESILGKLPGNRQHQTSRRWVRACGRGAPEGCGWRDQVLRSARSTQLMETRLGCPWISHCALFCHLVGLPGGSVVKNPPANAGDSGLIPASGRSRGEGHGNPLRYSCLENPMDRGAWLTTAHGVAKSRTQLSD